MNCVRQRASGRQVDLEHPCGHHLKRGAELMLPGDRLREEPVGVVGDWTFGGVARRVVAAHAERVQSCRQGRMRISGMSELHFLGIPHAFGRLVVRGHLREYVRKICQRAAALERPDRLSLDLGPAAAVRMTSRWRWRR